MKRRWFFVLIAVAAIAFAGCKPKSASPPSSNISSLLPTEAQPRLKTIKLWLGAQELITEMALSEREQMTGMMFRTNMAENEGMIFVMPAPERAAFWMKNCPMPLSCAYIGIDGTILEIHDMKPHDTNAIVANTENIQYVLETKQDWFARNGVGTNTVVSTERGPLRKVFLGH